eukprot:6077353-Pyramimonas_sp.AAC.1
MQPHNIPTMDKPELQNNIALLTKEQIEFPISVKIALVTRRVQEGMQQLIYADVVEACSPIRLDMSVPMSFDPLRPCVLTSGEPLCSNLAVFSK